MAGHTSYSAKSPAPLGLPDQLVVVVSVGVCYSQSAASAHNIKQNSIGHHRLIIVFKPSSKFWKYLIIKL